MEQMEYIALTDAQKAAQRKRNIAIGLGLAGFCVVTFMVALVRIYESINGAAA